MFDFSTPETTLQLLQDSLIANHGGPGVSELPLDEQTHEELKSSLAYTFTLATEAARIYGDDVVSLAVAEFNEVFKTLVDVDRVFRQRVIEGKTQCPVGRNNRYRDYAKGKVSEL
jgi:hypothetical protein